MSAKPRGRKEPCNRIRKLFAFAISGAAFFFSGTAFAQQDYPRDITVSWVNPDSYVDVDNTPMEPGDLEAIRIEIYRQNDTVPTMTATVPDTGEGASQVEVFAGAIPLPGTYRIEGYAIVIGGIESDPSIPAFKKYVGKPRPIIITLVE